MSTEPNWEIINKLRALESGLRSHFLYRACYLEWTGDVWLWVEGQDEIGIGATDEEALPAFEKLVAGKINELNSFYHNLYQKDE